MLLAIDIGNTNTVFALCEDDRPLHVFRCKTDVGRTADEYLSWILPHLTLRGLDFAVVSNVIIASVVPDADFNIRAFCASYLDTPPLFVSRDLIDIEITLDRPEQVGADRLVNAVAAREQYGAPAIIIDFGTATTFDVLDSAGRYSGGIIAPGINLSVKALHEAAARLPRITIARPDKVIGTDTISAMQSGVYWGYVGLVDGMLERIGKEIDGQPKIIATGGLADMFLDAVPAIQTVDKALTLNGLLYINRTVRSA